MDSKTKNTLLIVGAVVLAAVFVMFGAGKFIDPAKWIDKFAGWGIPAWFVPVSGALEFAGAVGLLLPVLRGIAGLGLATFMLGAVGTHVIHAEIGMIFVAGAILIASAALGWLRLPETLAFWRSFVSGQEAPAFDRTA
jgi:putative oxidoreductase